MSESGPFEFVAGAERCSEFMDGTSDGRFLFSLVISYTGTCEIPGITIAGADPDSVKFTPPADAEYLHYGYCKSMDRIPMTPDGKPTPALLTKTALDLSGIPHLAVSAGSMIQPQLPYMETKIPPGRNILEGDAMDEDTVSHAVDYGRMVGRNLASMTDCLVIGESIPGGTTTALAVLEAFGIDAKVSSSMPDSPYRIKRRAVDAALERIDSDNPYRIVAKVGDPMIAFVAGMLSSGSEISRVMLAGGTQMGAVLAFASRIGFNEKNTAVGTTSYVAKDASANFADIVRQAADVPAISIDPGLGSSRLPGLGAFSAGFAKEGAGAGGCMISSILKSGSDRAVLLDAAEKEYERLFTLR